jgi:hypothetical protein
MMVVPVLITNCQVSEKSKIGPEIPQTNTMPKAVKKAAELPVQEVMVVATRSKKLSFSLLFFFILVFAYMLCNSNTFSSKTVYIKSQKEQSQVLMTNLSF